MPKTSANEFLGSLGERVFHIFPILHSIMEGATHTFFVDHVTIFSLSPMQDLKWRQNVTKNGNN